MSGNMAANDADYIYDKKIECPVCGKEFTTKVLKTNRAKFLGSEEDLRPMYSGIDSVKYDVCMCPKCGYAAVPREFSNVNSRQRANLKEEIMSKFESVEMGKDMYTYDNAIIRFKMAILSAIKKPSKISESAYLCLKLSWIYRGVQESLQPEDGLTLNDEAKRVLAMAQEEENHYMREAYEGFTEALKTEYPPMCGMDEATLYYLMSVLAFRCGDRDLAMRYAQSVLTSRTANQRLKDKERDLMNKIKSVKI